MPGNCIKLIYHMTRSKSKLLTRGANSTSVIRSQKPVSSGIQSAFKAHHRWFELDSGSRGWNGGIHRVRKNPFRGGFQYKIFLFQYRVSKQAFHTFGLFPPIKKGGYCRLCSAPEYGGSVLALNARVSAVSELPPIVR